MALILYNTAMAWLVALNPAAQGKRFPLDTPCLIGRGPLNHIVIDDSRISRQHAKISPEDGGHVIVDLGSANGTFVNDAPVKRTKLQHKDVVLVGPFKFAFEDGPKRARTEPQFGGRMEIQTITGSVPPVSRIIDSVDAISLAPVTISGLAELQDAERKLRTLYAFMQSISSTLDVQTLVSLMANDLLGVFEHADLCTVYLRDETTAELAPRGSMRRDRASVPSPPLPVQVISEVVQKGRAILSQPMVPLRQSVAGVLPMARLTMHAPMIYRGNVEGVLEVHGAAPGGPPFGQRDLDILNALAALAAMALHSARLHVASLRQQRLQQDLLFAREIQKSFLPHQLPVVPGIDLAAEYAPAYSVGGDFYDLFWLTETQLGIFVGDVSGKGVSAALLMARMSSDLRAAALSEGQPGRALERLNKSLLAHGQLDVFITGVCMSVDVQTGTVLLANAGHLPPLVRRREGLVEPILGGAGTAIGFFENEEFPQVRFDLDPGDAIVLLTDGVLEAQNGDGEHFGFDRIQHSLASGDSGAQALAQRLLADLHTHVHGAAQYDDITLLVCRRSLV